MTPHLTSNRSADPSPSLQRSLSATGRSRSRVHPPGVVRRARECRRSGPARSLVARTDAQLADVKRSVLVSWRAPPARPMCIEDRASP